MTYPRLLVFCESPPSSTQGYGVTLATLVSNWPRDRIRVLYRSEIYRDEDMQDYSTHHAPVPGRLVRDMYAFQRGQVPAWNGKYSEAWIERTLGDWKPDIIYSFFYDASIPRYVEWLSRKFKCPYSVHIGDDNPSLKKGKDIPLIYQQSSAPIAISREMANEYENRYDTEFSVLHNGAADTLFEPAIAAQRNDKKISIRYIGSLLRDQHCAAIEDFIEAVKIVNQEQEDLFRFEIYCDKWTADLAKELADGVGTVYAGFAEKPRNYELLKTADLLLLPITFKQEHIDAYRFSMPTKLCEYLASGTPTLVYGPRGPAAVELCIRNDAGIVMTDRSVKSLVSLLREMVGGEEKFSEIGKKDQKFARKNLSARAMAEKFDRIMSSM